ncbi:MAG: response regulator [Burkholderiaceae bacterium]|jgi:signal transduction histidine kinase/HPt (histidine-containing phosphotransfer) domain-containing protein|nr:response regulator [Burkholderiaceae bacterium]
MSAQPQVASVDGGEPIVLVVDDLPQNATALAAVLDGLPMQVLCVHSARAALEALLVNDVSVALIDVNMPEMDGFELAEAMRGVQRTRHVPIIFVTAAMRDPLRSFRGYERGAVDFLQKPVDPIVIRSKVEVFMQLARIRAELQLRVDELDHHRRHLEEIVTQRVQELDDARREAEAASHAKSAFLANMSHEIRTPMNGVLGMLEVLERTPLSERQVELVGTARSSGETLLGIIDDILDVSKIEAGHLAIEPAPADVADLVEVLCESMAALAARRGVDLLPHVAPTLPQWLAVDALRLRQILFNLVGNAIKFSAGQPVRRGRVAVRVDWTDLDGGWLRLSVTDNGIGMNDETMARLFQPFVQGETSTTRRYGGTGLGLTICRRLATMMGGRIGVDSAPGEGARFTVTLPAPQPAGAEPLAMPGVSARPLRDLTCVILAARAFDDLPLADYLGADGARVIVVATLAQAQTALAAAHAAAHEAAHEDSHKATRGSIQAAAHASANEAGAVLVCDAGALTEVSLASLPVAGIVALGRGTATAHANDARVVAVEAMPLRRKALRHAVVAAAGGGLTALTATSTAARPAAEAPIAPPAAVALAQGELILVAEDDAINRQVIVRQLELLGRTAELASDGQQALAMWSPGRHALLLTDLHMPGLDGYGLAAAIREREAAAGNGARLPIVALSASVLADEQARVTACGMDAYLAKPVPIDQLRTLVDRWLPPRTDPATWPASAPAAAPVTFDVGLLQRLVGTDDSTVRQFLAFFLRSEVPLFDDLAQACTRGDVTAAAAISHRLRSSALTIGAAPLGALCGALEQYCRSDACEAPADRVGAALLTHLHACRVEFDAACEAIRAALTALDGADAQAAATTASVASVASVASDASEASSPSTAATVLPACSLPACALPACASPVTAARDTAAGPDTAR